MIYRTEKPETTVRNNIGCNYGAEMMVSEMPKLPSFFVNVGIAVKSVGLCQVQGNVPRVDPMGHFTFWGRGMPRNAPQVWV